MSVASFVLFRLSHLLVCRNGNMQRPFNPPTWQQAATTVCPLVYSLHTAFIVQVACVPGTKEQLKYRAKVAFMKKNCEAADPFTWDPKLPSDLIDTVKWSEKMDDTDVIRFWDETMRQIEGQATSFIENGAPAPGSGTPSPSLRRYGCPYFVICHTPPFVLHR